jgi:circadian clock protein KaiC
MVGTPTDVRAMLTRIIDFLKTRGTTVVFTALVSRDAEMATTETMTSSLMDTWILMTNERVHRRRHRWLYVLKSRGMAHSDETREFRLTDEGIRILAPQADAQVESQP